MLDRAVNCNLAFRAAIWDITNFLASQNYSFVEATCAKEGTIIDDSIKYSAIL
jgi:hypothetical protein